jgi:hypothetical protein
MKRGESFIADVFEYDNSIWRRFMRIVIEYMNAADKDKGNF